MPGQRQCLACPRCSKDKKTLSSTSSFTPQRCTASLRLKVPLCDKGKRDKCALTLEGASPALSALGVPRRKVLEERCSPVLSTVFCTNYSKGDETTGQSTALISSQGEQGEPCSGCLRGLTVQAPGSWLMGLTAAKCQHGRGQPAGSEALVTSASYADSGEFLRHVQRHAHATTDWKTLPVVGRPGRGQVPPAKVKKGPQLLRGPGPPTAAPLPLLWVQNPLS